MSCCAEADCPLALERDAHLVIVPPSAEAEIILERPGWLLGAVIGRAAPGTELAEFDAGEIHCAVNRALEAEAEVAPDVGRLTVLEKLVAAD